MAFRPESKSATFLANVTDPSVSRDSLGSAKFGHRTLWTTRDTHVDIGGGKYGYVFANTAGWTECYPDGSPYIQSGGPIGAGSSGSNNILLMKGPPPSTPLFLPLGPDMCPDNGMCEDGSRWIGWPDSPPMVTSTPDQGTVTAYAWTLKQQVKGLTALTSQPATTLYKLTYTPTDDPLALPEVATVDWDFWAEHQIGYGVYGNVVHDGIAYLYGTLESKRTAVARVSVESIEDKSEYEYYVNGGWTRQMPSKDDDASAVPNAGAGGQGTFYYSDRHQSYVWIGQAGMSVAAEFFITTSPKPEGPWIDPYKIYDGENGDHLLGGYSLQAHPHLLREHDDGIYVTWTQNFNEQTYPAYITPLVYISFV